MVRVMHFTVKDTKECFHFCRDCIDKLSKSKHERHVAFMVLMLEVSLGSATFDGARRAHCHECVAARIVNAEFAELDKETDRSLN